MSEGGLWSDTSTWSGGALPTADDDVMIEGPVIIDVPIEANSITIAAIQEAGLTVDAPVADNTIPYIRADVGSWSYMSMHPDHRVIDLTGLDVIGSKVGGFSCIQSVEGFYATGEILCQLSQGSGNEVIMASPAPLSRSATLEETSNISVTRQVARWRSAGIRRGTVSILWPKAGIIQDGRRISVEAMLDRMTRQPFRVLVYTQQWILCGHISSVSPSRSAGDGWQTVDVTIVEG